MFYDKKNSYWLRFLQIPKTKSIDDSKIKGYSKDRLKSFWNFSSRLQNFLLKTLVINGTLTMCLGGIGYLVAMRNFYDQFSPVIYTTIATANFLSLVILGAGNLTCIIGLMVRTLKYIMTPKLLTSFYA